MTTHTNTPNNTPNNTGVTLTIYSSNSTQPHHSNYECQQDYEQACFDYQLERNTVATEAAIRGIDYNSYAQQVTDPVSATQYNSLREGYIDELRATDIIPWDDQGNEDIQEDPALIHTYLQDNNTEI